MKKNSPYKLLPFKFARIHNQELLVNEVGDFLFVPEGTVNAIITGNIYKRSDLYKDLLSKYIICERYDKNLIDVIATRLRTKKAFLDGFTALHIFVLTLRCNQKCIYCQASSVRSEVSSACMSVENLSKAIDLMLQSPNSCITMEFQGGESSLEPELIKYAVIETERRNELLHKDIKYVLCTNIIQLSEDLLEFCREYNVFISTSLDGPSYLHDYNRGFPGSYDRFTKSLSKIREKLGQERVSPLMTTSEFSLGYPKEIVDAYKDLGFHNIFLRPLNPYGRAKDGKDWETYNKRFLDFYKTALEYIILLNKQGYYFSEDFTKMVLKKILTPFPIGFVDLQSPAGIINNVIVYNYDGFIYCSDESRMLAESGDIRFRLGHITDSYVDIFYGEKAQQLSREWATEFIAGCSDCAFFQYCGADPVRNYSTQGDSYGFRPTNLFCSFHKEVFEYIFGLLFDREKDLMPIFLSWVYGA